MAEKKVQSDTKKKRSLKKTGTDDLKEKTEDIKGDIMDKTSKTKEKAIEVKKGALEKTLDAKDKALDKTLEAKDKALMKTSQIKEDTTTKTSELKDEASEKKSELKENAENTRKQAENKISDFISSLKGKQDELGKTLSDYASGEKPLVDVISTPESFIVKADLPGLSKEDVTVHITEDSVDLTAKFEDYPEETEFIKKERNYGDINRKIKLPELIDVKKVSAKFENSVLIIELLKVQEDKIKIEIK
jgi:HSP20 family protein